MKRSVKQIIILVFVTATVVGIVFAVKWLLRVKPTCFDNIQNQNEEGVDCGSVCNKSCPTPKPTAIPLTVKDFQVVEGDGVKCDLVATIENPNNSLGGQHATYTMTWGSLQKKGDFYIYPGERERYVAEINLPCQKGVDPTMQIADPPNWQFFKQFEKPILEITDSATHAPSETNEFFDITGTTINKSPFDLKEIEIYAIVKSPSGKIIAVNKTTINSILVNEKRDFRLFWTHTFPQEEGSYKFYTTSNLFGSDNIMRSFGAQSTIDTRGADPYAN